MNKLERYRRTEVGVAQTIYDTQKRSCKHRGHNPPEYDRDGLLNWLTSQPNFSQLYNDWITSNCDRWKKPSVDRIDDYKSYTFDNIQLTTWKENNARSHRDMKNGINNKKSKSVIQLDLDGNIIKEFFSIAEAARQIDGSRWNIKSICVGVGKTYRGFKWEFNTTPRK